MTVLGFIISKISSSVTLGRYIMVKSCLLSLVNSLIRLADREILLVVVVVPQMQSSLLFKFTIFVSSG